MRNPTLREKVQMYEDYLHKINMCIVSCNNDCVIELVKNADIWSYSHRIGNGEISDRQQQKIINTAFWNLCNTPESDKVTKKRQKAYAKKNENKKEIQNL